MASNPESDSEILVKSHFIGLGLDKLHEKITFKELMLVNSLDTTLHHRDDLDNPIEISDAVLKNLFKEFVRVNEFNKL